MTTRKTIALTIRIFVSKMMSLLFNMLSRFVWASLVAQLVKNPSAMQETSVPFLGGKIPWRKAWNPLQYSCLENSMNIETGSLLSMGSKRVRHN